MFESLANGFCSGVYYAALLIGFAAVLMGASIAYAMLNVFWELIASLFEGK